MPEDSNNTIKIFTDWIKLKVKIHLSDKKIYPKERQIWWASIGQNIGVEINGKNERFERPVLIIRVFGRESILIVPLSTKIKEDKNLFSFTEANGRLSIANFSQIRTISSKRLVRKMEEVDSKTFDKIVEKLKSSL